MRAAFGVVSLLIALVVVGWLIRQQMRSADNAAAVAGTAPREQAKEVEGKVASDVGKAIEKAMDKASEARDAAVEK